MKKFISMMFAMLMVTSMAMAQSDNRPQQGGREFDPVKMAAQQTKQMVKAYALDDNQQAAISAVNKKYAEKRKQMMESMMKNHSQNSESEGQRPDESQMKAMHQQMETMQANYMSEVKSILSEKQYSKFAADEKARMQHHGHGNGNPQGGNDAPQEPND